MASNTHRIMFYNHLVTGNAVNNKLQLMGAGSFGQFTLNYEIIYKVVSVPASLSTLFSRFRHPGRTYTISTLKLDLALCTYFVS